MKKPFLREAILLISVSISWVAIAERTAAQGPAGSGASAAAQDGSMSLNPIKWMKKDPKNSLDTSASRSEVEKKLTPRLQAQGVVPADANVTEACAPFLALEGCLAALHASHNLAVDFRCLRAAVTGVHTNLDLSSCKVADGEKAEGLSKVLHQLKPEVNAKQATKDAEQQAKEDLKGVGG